MQLILNEGWNCQSSVIRSRLGWTSLANQRRRMRAAYIRCMHAGNQYNRIQYNIQHNTTRHDMIRCDTMQCNAMQYNTIQYNTISPQVIPCMHALRYNLHFFTSFRFNYYPTPFETSFRLPHLGGEYTCALTTVVLP